MIPKFRAWNTKSGRFAKDGELFLSIDSENYNLYSVDFDNFRLENDNYILMQYTGLKDKNGVEVYEGDLVSFEDSDGGYEYQDLVINTGIVEYGDLGFYFTNRVAVDMDDFYIKDGRCDEVEIIGNIYENPELLEVEE